MQEEDPVPLPEQAWYAGEAAWQGRVRLCDFETPPRPRRQTLRRKSLLHTQAEACDLLGISQHTLLAEIAAGRLAYVLVSKRRKFKPSDLTDYITKQGRGICEEDEASQLRGLGHRTATRASRSVVVDFDTASARMTKRKRKL